MDKGKISLINQPRQEHQFCYLISFLADSFSPFIIRVTEHALQQGVHVLCCMMHVTDYFLMLSKVTLWDPNITDLGDGNRPTKLSEVMSELYNNEWTDPFEAL